MMHSRKISEEVRRGRCSKTTVDTRGGIGDVLEFDEILWGVVAGLFLRQGGLLLAGW